MLVIDVINIIKNNIDYIENSFEIVHWNEFRCYCSYLSKTSDTVCIKKNIFISLNRELHCHEIEIENMTAIEWYYIQ